MNVRSCKWCLKRQPTRHFHKAPQRAFLEISASFCKYQQIQNYKHVCKSPLRRCDFHEQETKTSSTQGFNQ